MRQTLFAIALLLAAFAVHAAERKYAVLSIVGDRLMLVGRQPTTGSSLDSNTRQYAELATPAFDNVALASIDSFVKTAHPGATTVLLAVRVPAALRAQEKALRTDGAVREIVEALAPALATTGATHLILVTKDRHEARFHLRDSSVGSGYIEGLGFYIDRDTPIEFPETGERYVGFLAPFAYFRVSVVDLASSAVLKQESVLASYVVGNAETLHPWDMMTPEQKISSLQLMLRREIARVMLALLPPE
jgi:hypothetical protein